ncbi:hypothetical protein PAEPH01_0043 [Pancytospora epiphaga]|nr:hypothetical protein PAEPH01_0043 [Pancytospora epiphaga]
MELSKDYLLMQLYRVTPAEEALKALALYIRTFKCQYEMISDGIAYVHSKSSIHHRLLLFYLINEILYTERSSAGAPLCQKLREFLSVHFASDLKASTPESPIHRKLDALRRIWENRKIVEAVERRVNE